MATRPCITSSTRTPCTPPSTLVQLVLARHDALRFYRLCPTCPRPLLTLRRRPRPLPPLLLPLPLLVGRGRGPPSFDETTTSTTTSAQKWEQQLQTYWLQRLGAIKAALAPTVAMPPPVFSNADIEVLELGGGACTIHGHVRRWERYHTSIGNHPHPFTTEPLLAYLLQMEGATCGPTVIPSFCATVRWLSGRLRVPAPDLPSHIVSRLHERLLERRGVETRDIKEAPAMDVEHVRALENLVIECSATNVFKSTFAWQCLVMTWASMRFDDALHTCLSTVCLRDEGLHLTAWQTKVNKVRGAKGELWAGGLGHHRVGLLVHSRDRRLPGWGPLAVRRGRLQLLQPQRPHQRRLRHFSQDCPLRSDDEVCARVPEGGAS